jgi:hypothetical protein
MFIDYITLLLANMSAGLFVLATRLGGLFSRVVASLVLLAAAAMWALTAGMAYWGHVAKFSGH